MTTRLRYPEYDVRGRDIPREVFPEGRVRFSLGARRGVKGLRDRMEDLRHWGAWDVLRAIMDGRLHPRTVGQEVRREGRRAVAKLRQQLEAEAAGAVPTWQREVNRYVEWYRANRRPRSYVQVRSRLKRLGEQSMPAGAVLHELGIDQITKADIETAVQQISNNPNTQEALRLAASGLFRWSCEEEAERARTAKHDPRWKVNPAAKVERRERQKRVVTVAQPSVLRLIAAAEPYQEAYLRAFLHMGFRRAELMHTRLHDDLDLRDWRWQVQGRLSDARCGCPSCQSETGWQPKSKRSVRTLLVPDQPEPLRGVIARYLDLHPAEPGDFAFRNPRTNRVWDEGRLEADFATLCKRADVRYGARVPGGITLHALRHTCATELVRRGERESIIAALLGDSVDTIVEWYVHLNPQDLADAVSRGPRYEV